MSLLKNFIKYQSLGNDFIIFDWYKKPALYMYNELHDASWRNYVAMLCNRHYGVGADGVLIITRSAQSGSPEVFVYNADGSGAESCLNGLRSVAHYLVSQYSFPESFSITLGNRLIDCVVQKNKTSHIVEGIVTRIGKALCGNAILTIHVPERIDGYRVDVGNPHYIIFAAKTLQEVRACGSAISEHPAFVAGTNVEFVWQECDGSSSDNVSFNMVIYERGCGVTLACSSGAAALVGLLYAQGKLHVDEKITIKMPGGSVITWVEADGSIALYASAQEVFKGTLEQCFDEYVQKYHREQLAQS